MKIKCVARNKQKSVFFSLSASSSSGNFGHPSFNRVNFGSTMTVDSLARSVKQKKGGQIRDFVHFLEVFETIDIDVEES